MSVPSCIAASVVSLAVLASEPSSRFANAPRSSTSPRTLAQEVSAALAIGFPSTAAGRREQATKLLSLYTATGELSASQRGRLRLRLKSRLERLANAIQQDLHPSDARQASSLASKKKSNETSEPAGPHGGAPQDNGQALVDLIQSTIAPQTWDVNGGIGTIRYWPAWQVLVVRQTDDVHEQIGGALHNVRK